MAYERYFRAALGVIILLTTFVTGFHRFKAAQSGEKISRKDEGFLFALVLRLSGLVLFVVTIAYLIAPASVQWAMLPVPTWVRWIGVITGLLSSLLMYWTLSSLGKNLTDTVVIRNNATLVTDGPYRWQRRIKIPLETITWEMIDSVLEKPKRLLQATIPGTAKDGGPSCATLKPTDGWKVVK